MAYSADDIVASLRRILGRPITVVHESKRERPAERMLLVADIEKIRRATEWAPRVSLEETLTDLVAAYGLRTQPGSAR